MVAIGYSLNDIASSHNGENGENKDEEETEQGKQRKDDDPGFVMGTMTITVQLPMEWFQQKQMKHDKLAQPEWRDPADYVLDRGKKYGISKLRIPAVAKLQTDYNAAIPAPTTFGEHMVFLDIVPGIKQMPQGTSRPGGCHMRICSGKPQLDTGIPCLVPAAEPDSSPMLNKKPVEPDSFDKYLEPPQQITI